VWIGMFVSRSRSRCAQGGSGAETIRCPISSLRSLSAEALGQCISCAARVGSENLTQEIPGRRHGGSEAGKGGLVRI
jgi:hypothetical protein